MALKIAVAHVELPPLDAETGRVVVDRNGMLLRPFTIADGRWRLPVTLADVDPLFVNMLIAYEDRRFDEHGGVDVQALFRAACSCAARPPRLRRVDASRCRSRGCSTAIDARARRQAPPDCPGARARARLTKDEILDLYLTLAPYGGNIEGVRAASLAYLGKEPRRLTPPRRRCSSRCRNRRKRAAPTATLQAARAARDRVLDRAASAGVSTRRDAARPQSERVPDRRRAVPDARRRIPPSAPSPPHRRKPSTI